MLLCNNVQLCHLVCTSTPYDPQNHSYTILTCIWLGLFWQTNRHSRTHTNAHIVWAHSERYSMEHPIVNTIEQPWMVIKHSDIFIYDYICMCEILSKYSVSLCKNQILRLSVYVPRMLILTEVLFGSERQRNEKYIQSWITHHITSLNNKHTVKQSEWMQFVCVLICVCVSSSVFPIDSAHAAAHEFIIIQWIGFNKAIEIKSFFFFHVRQGMNYHNNNKSNRTKTHDQSSYI